MVRAEGLEPPRLAAREPKSRVSTNSTTPARRQPSERRSSAQARRLRAAPRGPNGRPLSPRLRRRSIRCRLPLAVQSGRVVDQILGNEARPAEPQALSPCSQAAAAPAASGARPWAMSPLAMPASTSPDPAVARRVGRVNVDDGAAVRRGNHGVGPLQQHCGAAAAGRLRACARPFPAPPQDRETAAGTHPHAE